MLGKDRSAQRRMEKTQAEARFHIGFVADSAIDFKPAYAGCAAIVIGGQRATEPATDPIGTDESCFDEYRYRVWDMSVAERTREFVFGAASNSRRAM